MASVPLTGRNLDGLKNFAFILPALAIFAVFYLMPFFNMFYLSLHQWPGIGEMSYVGLANFRDLWHDRVWWGSLGNAAYITLIALVFQNSIAFMLALACDREIRLKRFYRLVFFLPPILSEVVVGIIWNWILHAGYQDGQPIGFLNYLLVHSGLPNLVHNWLADPDTALACIAVVHAWKGFGWGFIILLAGLQTIDRQLYENARVDGAGHWSMFRYITLPMMMPIVLVVMVLTILGSMQVFVVVLSLVGQGLVYHTEVPVTRILNSMSGTNQFGYACAQAVIFGLVLLSVSFVLKQLSKNIRQA